MIEGQEGEGTSRVILNEEQAGELRQILSGIHMFLMDATGRQPIFGSLHHRRVELLEMLRTSRVVGSLIDLEAERLTLERLQREADQAESASRKSQGTPSTEAKELTQSRLEVSDLGEKSQTSPQFCLSFGMPLVLPAVLDVPDSALSGKVPHGQVLPTWPMITRTTWPKIRAEYTHLVASNIAMLPLRRLLSAPQFGKLALILGCRVEELLGLENRALVRLLDQRLGKRTWGEAIIGWKTRMPKLDPHGDGAVEDHLVAYTYAVQELWSTVDKAPPAREAMAFFIQGLEPPLLVYTAKNMKSDGLQAVWVAVREKAAELDTVWAAHQGAYAMHLRMTQRKQQPQQASEDEDEEDEDGEYEDQVGYEDGDERQHDG